MSDHEKQDTGYDPGDRTVHAAVQHEGGHVTLVDFADSIPFLVVDCETSGLPLFTEVIHRDGQTQKVTVAADDPRQPYLAQLAMIELDADFTVLDVYAGYVKPDGWTMKPDATDKNGLTDDFLLEHGRPVAEVLDAYEARLKRGPTLVAHNSQFDGKVLRGALRRNGRPDYFETTPQFCTMRAWAAHQHTKWPKLIDLCTMLGIHHEGPHKAIADAKATAELLPHFRRLGIEIDGRVHRSKYHPNQEEKA